MDGLEEMAEYDSSGVSRLARNERDPSRIDAVLAQVANGRAYVLVDALGSAYGLIDAELQSQTSYSYDAFGARTSIREGIATTWGFTGRRHETNVPGRTYYRNRYYESTVGIFDQADPIHGALIQGPHPRTNGAYSYALASPAMNYDPMGLSTEGFVDELQDIGLFFVVDALLTWQLATKLAIARSSLSGPLTAAAAVSGLVGL